VAGGKKALRKSTFDRWNEGLVGVGAFTRHPAGRIETADLSAPRACLVNEAHNRSCPNVLSIKPKVALPDSKKGGRLGRPLHLPGSISIYGVTASLMAPPTFFAP